MLKKQEIVIGHFNDGKSLRTLSRETGAHRKTVKKYINEHKELLKKQGLEKGLAVVNPPTYHRSTYTNSALTPEVCNFLDALLKKNEEHVKQKRSKICLKMIDMHEALVANGYKVSYTSVRRYVNEVLSKGKEAFIKQQYVPGQSVEFDWGEVNLILGGRSIKLMQAVFTSAHSDHRWSMLFHRQDMCSFLEAHTLYFSTIGGVAGEFTYDNMRTAVAKFAFKNKDKIATNDLLLLSTYYGFEIRFCNARSGNEKGHVERSVEYVRRKAFALHFEFDDLEAANAHLLATCNRLNQKPIQGQKISIADRFEEELLVMKAAPLQAFNCGVTSVHKADKLSCIVADKNHYSVPDSYVGRVVEVRKYPNRIECYDLKTSKKIAQHTRQYTVNQYFINLEHFFYTLQRKPGALLGSVAWKQSDELLHKIYTKFFKDQVKDFIALLLWCRDNEFDFKNLLETIEVTQKARPHLAINIDVVKLTLNAQTSVSDPVSTKPPSVNQEMIKQHARQQLIEAQQLFQS